MRRPRRLWWSFLWVRRWSVRWLIRSVRIATWTSGEPVSVSWRRCSLIVALLSGMGPVGERGVGLLQRSPKLGVDASPGTVAAVADESRGLRVTRTCRIPLDELEWRFTASGGPGGQHANTANTKA